MGQEAEGLPQVEQWVEVKARILVPFLLTPIPGLDSAPPWPTNPEGGGSAPKH